jgi:hypothetical protein
MIFKAMPHTIDKVTKAAPAKVISAIGGPTLQTALDKIAALEARLAKLENTVYIDADGSVTIWADGNLCLASQKKVVLDGVDGVLIQCSGNVIAVNVSKIAISSSSTFEVLASQIQLQAGTIKMNTAFTQCSGLVKCDTIQANSVIGASYTPGAGNIW